MKSIYSFLASLLVMAATASAQSATVPNFISYQGRVVDAAGLPVGASAPVNRTVIFRIWDHPSNVLTANLIYSESQVVTISNGEFSALVGQGVVNVTQTFGYAETTKKVADLFTVFSSSNRYLGVTVATGGTVSAADKEITPRQQIVATPFAMRASVAEFAQSIMSSSDLTLNPPTGTSNEYGLGWYGSGRTFNSVAIDGPVLYGKAGGALGSNNSGSQKTALRWDATGRVGIGATSITSTTNKLTLQGDMGTTPADQLTIRGNANNNERLLLGYDTSANRASLQSYTAASTTGSLLLNPSGGNVGINKIAPAVALDVTGSIAASTQIKTPQVTADSRLMTKSVEYWGSLPRFGSLFQSGLGASSTNSSATVGEMVLLGSPRLHMATANGGPAVMTLSGNNVGINNAAPSVALDVTGAIETTTSISAGTRIDANGKFVPTTDEAFPLKIVRGTVTSAGVRWYGSGFTVNKVPNQLGLYQITFTTPFSSPPSVTTAITGRAGLRAEVYNAGRTVYPSNYTDGLYPGNTGFTVGLMDSQSLIGAYSFGFQFIAIGPR